MVMEKKVPERKVNLQDGDVFYVYDKRINKCIKEGCVGTVKYGLVLRVNTSGEETCNCFECNKCHMKYTPYPNYVRLTKVDILNIYNQDEVTARDAKRAEDARKQALREKRKNNAAKSSDKKFDKKSNNNYDRSRNKKTDKSYDGKNDKPYARKKYSSNDGLENKAGGYKAGFKKYGNVVITRASDSPRRYNNFSTNITNGNGEKDFERKNANSYSKSYDKHFYNKNNNHQD